MFDVSTIVVTWKTRDLLRACVRSVLERTTGVRMDVIVIDNASGDGSCEMVRTEFPGVRLIANRTNLGLSEAANHGIAESRSRYILFLNPDTEARGNAVGRMVEFMDAHPEVGALGTKLLNTDGSLQPSCYSDIGLHKAFAMASGLADLLPYGLIARLRPGHIIRRIVDLPDHESVLFPDCFVGATMMFRREAIEQAGPFDPQFFVYWSEVDEFYRLRRLGWKIAYTPHAVFTHHGWSCLKTAYRPLILQWWKGYHLMVERHFGARRARLLRAVMLAGAALCWPFIFLELARGIENAREKFRTYGALLAWGLAG